jgi:heme exporter protein C
MTAGRAGRWITVIALLLLAGVYVRALEFTPVEATQGLAQKIFYVHVPAAWSAMLSMGFVGLASILFLFLKDSRYDRFAAASAEVGTVFCLVMLTTGPLWAKPIWGTWWTWDARLTLTLMLFFMFIGYQLLRGVINDPGLRARYAAVVGICGLVLLPFIHLSVYLFRTLHPQPIILKPSAPSAPPEMVATLLMSFGVFTLLYIGFVTQRYAIGREGRSES